MTALIVAMVGLVALLVLPVPACADVIPPAGSTDPRVRTVLYDPYQVYRLHGYVGWATHIIFAAGETFVGLGGGDVEGVSWDAESNHLFLKPRQPHVQTNLTLITSQRTYEIHYSASRAAPETPPREFIYALHFTYPEQEAREDRAAAALHQLRESRPASRNEDFWYCGADALKPVRVWDDGMRTWIRFAPTADWPAVFALSEDGQESLVNYSVEGPDLVVHRVAPRFVLRRGRLVGCVLNRGFAGSGLPTSTGTASPEVIRNLRGDVP